ncbi:MAG: hypothetical protein IAB19_01040 [Proteobacteria bacterium]|uniref:Uncharacterized protein n=1 Tax=Candidatus Avisuccinivibrio stercorigallinarum TaxID=2840704 RepID=A0A9D9GRZ4_9GAMM|nr:hypothetical protein [Candidatus Avisuccinivibrio stercorigallinarum]
MQQRSCACGGCCFSTTTFIIATSSCGGLPYLTLLTVRPPARPAISAPLL